MLSRSPSRSVVTERSARVLGRAGSVWQTTRILNGDQTDRGLNFRGPSAALVHIRLHKLPLYDEAVHRNVE